MPGQIVRALILSGGGAKGVFEAGVIHALIQAGLPIHILTGSSIGALNAAFFAEYLYRAAAPDPAEREDESQLRARLRAYLDLWESLADERFVDLDSAHFSPILGSLANLRISVGDLARAFWLLTTPDPAPAGARQAGDLRAPFEELRSLLAVLRIVVGIAFQISGGPAASLRLLQRTLALVWRHRAAFTPQHPEAAAMLRLGLRTLFLPALQARLRVLNIERAIFLGEDLRQVFTRPRFPGPRGAAGTGDGRGFIPSARRFSTYYRAGIDLRLTRANLRSGRLEYSAFVTPGRALFGRNAAGDFELKRADDLRVFGDPRVIDAALASGAFPAVFPPRGFDEIYPAPEPGEAAVYQDLLLDFVNYLARCDAGQTGDPPACRWTEPDPATGAGAALEAVLSEDDWREIALAFPRSGDGYTDGGVIDNTPLASAIAAARQAGATELQAMVVMLHPAPRFRALGTEEARRLGPLGIGLRALELQTTTRLEQDANHAEALTGRFADLFREAGVKLRPQAWDGRWTGRSGFMPVEVIRLWPDAAEPLPSLFAFDERLGYNRARSRAALTQGCASALWALWEHWQKTEVKPADERAATARRRVFDIVRPRPGAERPTVQTWRCANHGCRYFQEHDRALRCRRAESLPGPDAPGQPAGAGRTGWR